RYPPPAVACTENFAAPSRDRGKDARAKVARGVDGVTGVETEAGADQKHEGANQDGSSTGVGRKVQAIRKGEENSNQQRRAHNLVHHPAGKDAEERLRVGG